MAQSKSLPRRFAPLRDGVDNGAGLPILKGVVFDMDGTLCIPQTYMFAQMRSALSIPKSVDILEHIYTLPTPAAQSAAMSQIQAIELTAMAHQTPQPGLNDLMSYLSSKAIPKAICTRNFDGPVNHLLDKFLKDEKFEPVVTREFRPPKPHPAGIWHIAREWGLDVPSPPKEGEEFKDAFGESGDRPERELPLIMVGDSVDDMTAGYRAGAATVLLVNEVNAHLAGHEHTDLCISRLDELVEVLERGFVGRVASGEDGDTAEGTRTRAEEVLRVGRGEV